MNQIDESQVVDRIFRHANHIECQRFDSRDDAVFVKEKLIMADGSVKDNLRAFYNYERPFWIVRDRFRNYKQKKEREDINKLQEFKSTQRQLVMNIKRAMQNFYLGDTLRDVSNSPYLYGTDIEIESILYNDYARNRKTEKQLPYVYGAYDIETYMDEGPITGEPIMASLVTSDVIQTTVHRHFIRQYGEKATELITNLLHTELGHFIEELGLTFELEIVDDPGMVAKRSIERIHETDVDVVGIWNIDFDIPKIVQTLVNYNHPPNEVFSDPSVPQDYKYFRYVQGPSSRKTDAGKIMPLSPAERWHYAVYPAKWNMLDSMCVYADMRKAGGKEPYGLDAVLKKNIDMGKLKFSKANHLKGGEWHTFMQHNYPLEYIIYNIFDCLGMILLDRQTQDISINFPLLIGSTHISRAMSNPRKFCNDVHFRLMNNEEDKSVLGTTGKKETMVLDIDEKLPDKAGWVMTLSADMCERVGVNVVSDVPGLKSSVFMHVSDLDIEGTYPSEQVAYNVSKETTRYEVQRIEGVGWEERRRWGVLMNAGEVNCVQLATNLFNFPPLDALLEKFEQELVG